MSITKNSINRKVFLTFFDLNIKKLVFLYGFIILKDMSEREIYLTGEGVSLEKMQKFSKLYHLPLWPSKAKPFLAAGSKRQMPSVCVIIGDVTEERFKEILKLPIDFFSLCMISKD